MTSRDPATPNYDTQPEANALPYGRSSGQGIASNSASYAPRQEARQRPTFDPPTQRVQQTAAAGPPSLCLEGRCPVTFYDTQKWMHGDRRFGAVHRGRLFLFSSAAAQQRFLADPDKYSPAVSGHDAVAWVEQGQLVPGMMKFGGQYRNIVYLFSSEATLRQFEANPERYAAAVEQEIAAGRNQGQIRR